MKKNEKAISFKKLVEGSQVKNKKIISESILMIQVDEVKYYNLDYKGGLKDLQSICIDKNLILVLGGSENDK